MATLTEQIENTQQLIDSPRRVTRATLTRANGNDVFIEGLMDVNLDEKCDDLIVIKIINIQEANLHEASILPVTNVF